MTDDEFIYELTSVYFHYSSASNSLDMSLYPKVITLDPTDTTTDTNSDTDEETNHRPDKSARPDYVADEECYMASVRLAVMGLPEPESDPETDPKDLILRWTFTMMAWWDHG